MTTQNTHHENSDVDTSVVEYSSTPDTTSNTATETPPSPEAAEGEPAAPTSAQDQGQEETHSATDSVHEHNEEHAHTTLSTALEPDVRTQPEPLAENEPVQEQFATPEEPVQDGPQALESASDTTPTAENTPADSPEPSVAQEIPEPQKPASDPLAAAEETVPEITPPLVEAPEAATEATAPSESVAPVAEAAQVVAPASEDVSEPAPTQSKEQALAEAKNAEVRPFTDLIEEFRRAEEARLQAALREAQVGALTSLRAVETALSTSATADSEKSAAISDETSKKESTPILEHSLPTTQASAESVAVEDKSSAKPATEDKEIPARPVSPLLRPATRLRVPRHGLTRHQREEQAAAEVAAAAQAAQAAAPTPASVEAVAESAPARPTRRYRFDRPTSPVIPASPAPVAPTAKAASEETRVNGQIAALPEFNEPATATASAPATVEQNAPKQITQEVLPVEPVVLTPPPSAEHGRRRHAQKEHPVSAAATPLAPVPPVVEKPAPPVASVEPTVQPEEIAPEDLPPLEYAELQKASSRRRRRHRSGSSPLPAALAPAISAAAPIVPIIPVAPVVPPPAPQHTPVAQQLPPVQPAPIAPPVQRPTNNASTYTIVSGYTVNQMNQGSEGSGPFMGPDPSPARGSVNSRDGRTTRAENQRTPTPAASYASRPSENGMTAASMNQFANAVSQAIQIQTDRMIAEMRRANQAPTNVSVTLPPFPSTERVGVFVDVANLLYSARTLRMAVDFGKLLDFLRGNRRLVRAHAYCPTSPQVGDEQMFLQAVKGLGYRITTKNYKTFSSGAKKADLDLDLCMDVVRLVDGKAVDCVVLVSGDSDFMPMLDYCSDHGVRVEVAAFDEAMSATLRQSCDLFVNLSMLDEIRA